MYGTNSLQMYVNQVEQVVYEGVSFRVLHVSDADNLFSGSIVSGIGHLTSFFPERLMKNDKGYRVEGIRCYWRQGELVFKYGERDCDDIYEQLHQEVDESLANEGFKIYPNPVNTLLFVIPNYVITNNAITYRITNILGQTLMSGQINGETNQIDLSNLSSGFYFITIGNSTQKLIKCLAQ